MPVQAMISITYQAESAQAIEDFVNGLSLPDGAQVSASASEQVVAGIVSGGTVSAPQSPAPEPAP